MKRRVLGLLSAGRAPAAWLRRSERSGARLRAVERGTAWAAALAAARPTLREGPLLGGVLDALSSLDAGPASSSAADTAAFPTPTRRGDPAPAARRRAANGAAPSRDPADPRPARARTPRARLAAAPPLTAPHRPRPAALSRRADEGELRRWSGPVAPSVVHATGGASEWEALVRRASRAALTPSPHTLPALACADRLAGWRAGSSAAPPLPPPERVQADASARAFGGEADAGGWIGAVARRVARRFLRTLSVRPAGGSGATGWMDRDDPRRPRLADAAHRVDAADRRRDGMRADDPPRPRRADAAGRVESAVRRLDDVHADDPRRPQLADVAGRVDPAERRTAWLDADDPHRPRLAGDAGGREAAEWRSGHDAGEPHRPLPADATEGAADPHRPHFAGDAGGWEMAARRSGHDAGEPHRPLPADATEGAADPHRPHFAGDAGGWEMAARRSGHDAGEPHRPLPADATEGAADPHHPHFAGDAGEREAVEQASGSHAQEPHRPLLADAADGAAGPDGPWRADAGDGAVPVLQRLALEWGAPLDGPAAPADVLARLASGRPRAVGQGTAPESPRHAAANAAASLLRQARREASGEDGGGADEGSADAPSAPGGRPRRQHAVHAPSLVRELADRASPAEGGPRPIRAVATADGVLRPSAHPLFAFARAGGVRGRRPGADTAAGEDGRDTRVGPDAAADAEDRERWIGWPAVLPWPRGLRTTAAEARPRQRLPVTGRDGAQAEHPIPPARHLRQPDEPRAMRGSATAGAARGRRPADASGGEPSAALPMSPAIASAADATPRGPIATAGDAYRPAGPLPPPLTSGPFPPRAAVIGEAAPDAAAAEAARPPAPLATGEDAAPWAEEWGVPRPGAYAAGHPFLHDAGRAAEELDDALARRLKRILDEEARRYGIDV